MLIVGVHLWWGIEVNFIKSCNRNIDSQSLDHTFSKWDYKTIKTFHIWCSWLYFCLVFTHLYTVSFSTWTMNSRHYSEGETLRKFSSCLPLSWLLFHFPCLDSTYFNFFYNLVKSGLLHALSCMTLHIELLCYLLPLFFNSVNLRRGDWQTHSKWRHIKRVERISCSGQDIKEFKEREVSLEES